MEHLLSGRIKSTPPSSIRGILKTAVSPGVISLAGGLPNPVLFLQGELLIPMERIVRDYGSSLFQYSITIGPPELRQYVADRYNRRFGFALGIENILITTGSQQALGLISRVLLNAGDGATVEEPSYFGAMQASSQYQPVFYSVKLTEEGMDVGRLKNALAHNIKFIYATPDFQDPIGLSYSAENGECIRKVLTEREIVLVGNGPYGELRFNEGGCIPYIGAGRLSSSVLLETFLKAVTPGIRTGFMICTNIELLKHVSVTKEASDLHINIFSQYLIWDYPMYNDYGTHIPQIRRLYKEQAQVMTEVMDRCFPKTIRYTQPHDGIFLWVTLPESVNALSLFPKALGKKVISIPDDPFYINMANTNTMYLNYINTDCRMIDEGIHGLEELSRGI